MKPSCILTATTAAAIFALTACSDPADKTADAVVSEPVAEAPAPAEGVNYNFAEGSTIGFIGSKVTGSHEGGFKKFTGHFVLENGKPVAGHFTIQMNSTWSDAEKLTGHLLSADFFDVENHPETTFEVSAFTEKPDGQWELSGNLTLHGVTKNITFPAQVTNDDTTVKIDAEFDINRKDFGIVYPGRPDDLIRDNVVIKFALVATPEA
jgi:polyisoprenoid-binding protein YceI